MRKKTHLMPVLGLLAAALLSGCNGGGIGRDAATVRGIVNAGYPSFPSNPLQGAVVRAFRHQSSSPPYGPEAARTATDTQGLFSLRLEPGRYVIEAEPPANALPLELPLRAQSVDLSARQEVEIILGYVGAIQ